MDLLTSQYWEASTCENTIGKLLLGKLPLGKDPTSRRLLLDI